MPTRSPQDAKRETKLRPSPREERRRRADCPSNAESQLMFLDSDDLFDQLLTCLDPTSFALLATSCKTLYQRMLALSTVRSLPYNLCIARTDFYESKRVQNLALSRDGKWLALDDRSREGVLLAKLSPSCNLESTPTIVHQRSRVGCISSL